MTRRLLFVDNDGGTFLLHRFNLARSAAERGYDVHVALPVGTIPAVVCESFETHSYRLNRRGTNPTEDGRSTLDLYNLYRRLRPNIVHHLRLKPVLYGGAAAVAASVPAAVHMLTGLGHVFGTTGWRATVARAAVKCGLGLAFSHRNCRVVFENADDCAELSSLFRNGTSVVVNGSGVDPDVFSFHPEPALPVVVTLASRMLWSKGIQQFVDAADLLRSAGLRARFVLAGDTDLGNPSAIPPDTLQTWNRQGRVEWLGWQRDMPGVLSASHIVCLPSLYREGIPRVLIEAAAIGRPLVATDSPGCREIVDDSINGFLVPQGRIDRLADAIGVLATDASLRARMGAHGRLKVLSGYSQASVLTRIFDTYETLV